MSIKIYYPTVFQKEGSGYSVWVPDIEGCVSQGETIGEATDNIADAIGAMLETYADHGVDVPAPSAPETIRTGENQFVSVVAFDPAEFDRKYSAKAVKKTLTIPKWLNEAAVQKGINFSQTLQDALMTKISQ